MSDKALSHAQIAAAVQQHVRTLRLLGVEAVPAGAGESLAVRAVESREVEALPVVTTESEPPAQEPVMTDETIFERDEAAAPSPYATMSREEKQQALDALREEHDRECPHCTQATAHTQTVFGEGSADAGLMFVGEAPGAEEDRQGRPFVGRSGQKLTEMIEAMGFSREEVYIANVLKARPPDNATPTLAEAAKCGPYLRRQIEIIQPKVIVTLGGPAAKLLLETRLGVTKIRGTWHAYQGTPVMPTFHPAYLLRQYTPENRQKVWSDLQAVLQHFPEKS